MKYEENKGIEIKDAIKNHKFNIYEATDVIRDGNRILSTTGKRDKLISLKELSDFLDTL